jgi:hypothetical protein
MGSYFCLGWPWTTTFLPLPLHSCSYRYVPQGVLDLFFDALMIVVLIEVRLNFNLVLICISKTAKNADCFSIYLLDISTTSFERCLFRSFAHLLIGLLTLFFFLQY